MPILYNVAFGYITIFYEGHYVLLPEFVFDLMSVTAVPTRWLMSRFKKIRSDVHLKRKCLVITGYHLSDFMR